MFIQNDLLAWTRWGLLRFERAVGGLSNEPSLYMGNSGGRRPQLYAHNENQTGHGEGRTPIAGVERGCHNRKENMSQITYSEEIPAGTFH